MYFILKYCHFCSNFTCVSRDFFRYKSNCLFAMTPAPLLFIKFDCIEDFWVRFHHPSVEFVSQTTLFIPLTYYYYVTSLTDCGKTLGFKPKAFSLWTTTLYQPGFQHDR